MEQDPAEHVPEAEEDLDLKFQCLEKEFVKHIPEVKENLDFEVQCSEQDPPDHVPTMQKDMDLWYDVVKDLSNSDPDMDNNSVLSLPKPKPREYIKGMTISDCEHP